MSKKQIVSEINYLSKCAVESRNQMAATKSDVLREWYDGWASAFNLAALVLATGLGIATYTCMAPNPQSAIRNPQSAVV